MFYALNRKQIIHNWTLLPSTSHIYCLEWYLMYATEIWVSLHCYDIGTDDAEWT